MCDASVLFAGGRELHPCHFSSVLAAAATTRGGSSSCCAGLGCVVLVMHARLSCPVLQLPCAALHNLLQHSVWDAGQCGSSGRGGRQAAAGSKVRAMHACGVELTLRVRAQTILPTHATCCAPTCGQTTEPCLGSCVCVCVKHCDGCIRWLQRQHVLTLVLCCPFAARQPAAAQGAGCVRSYDTAARAPP